MTIFLNLLGFAAMGFVVVFPISFAVTAACRFMLSWRRRVRRAREVKAEAVREQERSMAHRRAALQKQWVAAVKLNRMVQMKARDASWN